MVAVIGQVGMMLSWCLGAKGLLKAPVAPDEVSQVVLLVVAVTLCLVIVVNGMLE